MISQIKRDGIDKICIEMPGSYDDCNETIKALLRIVANQNSEIPVNESDLYYVSYLIMEMLPDVDQVHL